VAKKERINDISPNMKCWIEGGTGRQRLAVERAFPK
jgi:hypothetical protein